MKNPVTKDPVIEEFLSRIAPLRSRIDKIILFGSHARGEAAPWSDYDLLIVVPDRDRVLVDQLYDAVVQVLCATEKELSLKIFSREKYSYLSGLHTPFMQNIQKEGILLG